MVPHDDDDDDDEAKEILDRNKPVPSMFISFLYANKTLMLGNNYFIR